MGPALEVECGGLNETPWAHIFEFLVIWEWKWLRKTGRMRNGLPYWRRCSLVGGSHLEVNFVLRNCMWDLCLFSDCCLNVGMYGSPLPLKPHGYLLLPMGSSTLCKLNAFFWRVVLVTMSVHRNRTVAKTQGFLSVNIIGVKYITGNQIWHTMFFKMLHILS